MNVYEPLLPPPGNYRLPTMQLLRCASTDSAEFIQLIFQTDRRGSEGQPELLTISVPLHVLDAAGLLRSLRILQEKGIVPHVAEPSPGEPN